MKESGKMPFSPALRISTCAVLTAVTAVFTLVVRIPIAPTRGYLNLGDVAIYFSAFTFGPFTAFIAGGMGTALADLLAGYPQWAPISFIVHGMQGLTAGMIAGLYSNSKSSIRINLRWLLAAVVGTIVMCTGYLAGGTVLVGFGAALVELPGNIIQNLAGILGGIPLALAVRRAYPPVVNFRW